MRLESEFRIYGFYLNFFHSFHCFRLHECCYFLSLLFIPNFVFFLLHHHFIYNGPLTRKANIKAVKSILVLDCCNCIPACLACPPARLPILNATRLELLAPANESYHTIILLYCGRFNAIRYFLIFFHIHVVMRVCLFRSHGSWLSALKLIIIV